MDNLSKRLRNKIEVWGSVECENELGEKDYYFQNIKSIWAEIKPVNGAIKTITCDIIQVDMKNKITI